MTHDNNCKDCKERTPTCHATCEKYLAYLERNEKNKAARKRIESKRRDFFYKKTK